LRELTYRKPFVPFYVEFQDGRRILVETTGVAFGGGVAGFISETEGLVDFAANEVQGFTLCDKGNHEMPSTIIDVKELPKRIQEIISVATSGTEVIVTDGDNPIAKLIPCAPQARKPGLHPGAITITEDFDAPLPEDFWMGTS